MSNLIKVTNKGGTLVVSSREIAKDFGKEHYHVIEAIENKIKNLTHEKAEVKIETLFIETQYNHRGNIYKEFLLTRDGFSFIVMGFTGAKADMWKLKYIEAFNKMEQHIKEIPRQEVENQKEKEIEARLKNARAREANILLKIAEKTEVPKEYKQVLYSHASQIIVGQPLLPLPKAEKNLYSRRNCRGTRHHS